MQSKPMHMDIKIHITSYKLHGYKAAIFRFKTPNKHNNGDNIRNIKLIIWGEIQKNRSNSCFVFKLSHRVKKKGEKGKIPFHIATQCRYNETGIYKLKCQTGDSI
jgi:hypothetical protein